jgi:hypothetical protein
MSTGVMSALIGSGAALAVVLCNALAQRRLEVRRRRDELVAAAISDVFAALAQSAFGATEQANERYTRAKAQLITYGSPEVITALTAFMQAGANTLNGQRAIVELARWARKASGEKRAIATDDAIALLFNRP